MDVVASVDAPCAVAVLRPWVADLDRYPAWLSIVPKAERLGVPDDPDQAELDGHPAWAVELRAKLGPLARSKRLRMVRTLVEDDHVRFERWELDGKEHSPWVLDVRIEATDAGSNLTMKLHYGGGLGESLLERLLRDEIEESKPRLIALVSGP